MRIMHTLALFSAALALSACTHMRPDRAAHGGHQAGHHHNGMVMTASPYSAAETLSRLQAQVTQRNLAVVSRVDHAAAAAGIGQALRATEVMVFGNPQAGTPLMVCAQAVGIDLPMKALVWVDAKGQTWLGYNDPVWVVRRHGGGDCPAALKVQQALAAIAAATVAK